MLTCAIIDDEPLARELLKSYVENTDFLEYKGEYYSAVSAISELTKNPVDIVFLDIQMPNLDGIQFSRILPQNTKVIFTTAFAEYAVEGFKVDALDYLLKPISYEQFLKSANKALKWFQQNKKRDILSNINSLPSKDSEQNNFIYVKSDYKLIQVPFHKILYIEGLKDYLKIFLEDEQQPIVTLLSMKTMEERLPKPYFMRVHRSFIVNLPKVKIINKGLIHFGNTHIPVSDTYRDDFMAYVNEHIL